MQEILLRIRYSERGLSNTFIKVNFNFSFEPSPLNRQRYKKQKRLELVTTHSSGYKISSQKVLY